jgi:uncharacterized protein GlcG (DUF336 family)
MSLTLSEALACADAGIAKAKEMGVKISVVVIDEFGQLVQMDRMDGASLMSPDIAEAKAVTALNFRRPTSAVAAMDRSTLETLGDVVNFKVVALAGGVPLFEGDEIRGAIGVSGATAQQDEEVAIHAAKG